MHIACGSLRYSQGTDLRADEVLKVLALLGHDLLRPGLSRALQPDDSALAVANGLLHQAHDLGHLRGMSSPGCMDNMFKS